MKKLLLIDNYDSFTYNLVQYFQEFGVEVVVKRNDEIALEEAKKMNLDYLVFSPGPGSVEIPSDVGVGPDLFKYFKGKIPILGVCLGQQMIGHILGGKIRKVGPVHGKRWSMKVLSKAGLFMGFGDDFEGMRYHSMIVDFSEMPEPPLTISAITNDEDGFIMAFEDTDQKIFGVQFHPESVGTKTGKEMLKNFLNS